MARLTWIGTAILMASTAAVSGEKTRRYRNEIVHSKDHLVMEKVRNAANSNRPTEQALLSCIALCCCCFCFCSLLVIWLKGLPAEVWVGSAEPNDGVAAAVVWWAILIVGEETSRSPPTADTKSTASTCTASSLDCSTARLLPGMYVAAYCTYIPGHRTEPGMHYFSTYAIGCSYCRVYE